MSSKNLRLLVSFASSDKLSGPLKKIVGLGESGSERLAAMKKEARGLGRELRNQQGDIARVVAEGGKLGSLVQKERQLKEQVEQTNRAIERQTRLNRINASVDAMKQRGADLRSSGVQNVTEGGAILAPLALAGKGAMDFQSGMTDIALKAELSRKETALLKGNIIAAARAAKQLPESMRAGVDTLAGFGLTPQQAAQMVSPIGKVATAYKAEIDDLASASYANFSNLKIPINQTGKALEIMASAGNAGAFEIKDMAQYFPSLTAAAQALGQKGVSAIADLSAAAQIARKGTGDSASAATNLQNLLAKINTAETIKKFDKFGVDLPAAMKKAYAEGKTPLEAIATITNQTLGGDLSKISFLFGDMQAQQALRPLIQNMDEYRKIRTDALASKGAVDAAFARRTEDANVSTRAMIGNLQRMAIVAGPVLLPPLVALTEKMLLITDRVTGWMQANPKATKTIITMVAGLGALKIGLGALQIVFGTLLGPFSTVFRLVMTNGPMLIKLFGGMRTAALFLARGVLQAGAMMLANPIVLVITAIVAAVGLAGYLIYKHWDKISGAFKAGVAWVKSAIGGLPDWLKSLGGMMMQGLLAAISPGLLAQRLVAVARSGIAAFKNFFGIKSPSRLMMGMGGYITDGLAAGIDRGRTAPIRAARTMAAGVTGASLATASMALAAPADTGPSRRPAFEAGQSLASAARTSPAYRVVAGSDGATIHIGSLTINVQAAPGQSPQDIADAIEEKLKELDGSAKATKRSSFADDDD